MVTMPVCFWALFFVPVSLSGVESVPVSEKDSIRAVELYNEGKLWLQKGGDKVTRLRNYETSRMFYREAMQTNPSFVEPRIGLGWALLYSDSSDGAIREFELVKGMQPSHRMPYYGLGRVYMKAKRWKDAERELRMAVAVWPYFYQSELKGDRVKALICLKGDLDYRYALTLLSEALAHQGKQKEGKFWGDSAAVLNKIKGRIAGNPLPPPPCTVSVSVLGFSKDSLLFISLPQITDTAKINYPQIAQQVGIAGSVRLILSVNSKGEVVRTQISRSSRNEALDEAAKGISKAKFSPFRLRKKGKKGNSATICEIMVQVDFQILDNRKR